jgi:hypothetical protein
MSEGRAQTGGGFGARKNERKQMLRTTEQKDFERKIEKTGSERQASQAENRSRKKVD